MDSTYSSLEALANPQLRGGNYQCTDRRTSSSPLVPWPYKERFSRHQSKPTLQHTQYLHAHPRFSASASTMPAVTIRSFTFRAVLNDCSAAHDVQEFCTVCGSLEKMGLSPSAEGRKKPSPHPVRYPCPILGWV